MAQSSILWATTGVGHGLLAGYSQAQVTEWMRLLAAGLTGADLSGVGPDYQNELAVTGTVSPVAVNTGGAFVYGYPFFNTASENIVVPTPSVSTRIDRIVLEVNWAAQTVLLARVAGTEGAGAPALTQTAGTTWQMALAQVSITTGGVITVTDQREWLSVVGDGSVATDKLVDSAVTTAKIADSNVTLGKMADNSVGTSELIDLNVTTGKINDLAVTTGKIADSNVTLSKMADNSVGTAELVDLNVTTGKLANDAVTTAKIADSNITLAKMADNSVGTTELVALSVTSAKIADGAALAEILDDDGAGSGLDADLLDGVEGSGYSTTSHNHTLDALSNVNMAGKLTDDFAKWNGTSWVPAIPVTGTVADNAVTMAKLADLATDSLIGRDAAGTGDPIAITLAASLSFTGSNTIQRAALTGDVTASANSNTLAIANDVIEYTDMRPQYAFPLVVYSPGANFDFTTTATVDFDTLALDYDGPNLFTNDGAGVFTVAAACNVEVVVSGYVGHATGTTEAFATIFIEIGSSASVFSTLAKTNRTFLVPASNWGGFHTMGVTARAINEKVRVRIERAAGSDTLRLSNDSSIILRAFS